MPTYLKSTLVIWSPFTIEPTITGFKINEVERIRTVSKQFITLAFVLISLNNIPMVNTYKRYWFGEINAKIVVLPWLDTYGVRIISRLAAGTIAAMTVALLHLRRRVNLIITRDGVSSLPLALVARWMNITLLYNVLSVPFGHKEAKLIGGFLMQNRISINLFKVIEYFVLQSADFVGVITPTAANEIAAVFGKHFQSKIVIIPFPISDEFFRPDHSMPPRRTIRLIYNGAITGLYDFSRLIKAIEELHIVGKDIDLVVYSSPRGRQILTSLTSMDGVLVLRDQLQRSDMIKKLREATAVVVPLSARSPGISVKAIEAMAVGVPVLISYPKDSRIFRDGETCIVVPENTTQRWRSAIMRVTVPETRDKIVRAARSEAEAFRSNRNLDVISAIITKHSKDH